VFGDISSCIIENGIAAAEKVGTIMVTTKSFFLDTRFNGLIQINNYKVGCGIDDDYTE